MENVLIINLETQPIQVDSANMWTPLFFVK